MFTSLMRQSGQCLRNMSSAFHQISSGVFFDSFSWNFGVGSAVFSMTSRMTSESGLYAVEPSGFVPPRYIGWPQ